MLNLKTIQQGALLCLFSLLPVAPALAQQPQVSDADIQSYVATFSQRSKPNVRPRIQHQALVNQLSGYGRMAWFVGKWETQDGFVVIYPTSKPDRACVIIKTDHNQAYAEGNIQGSALRTGTPLFTDSSERFLKYAAGDVFLPVLNQGNAYLGWGLFDPQAKRSRFLTLGFQDAPPNPTTFLTPGAIADRIKAQFLAAGCQDGSNRTTADRASTTTPSVRQTLDGVTAELWATSVKNQYQLRIRNNTATAFGIYPNQVLVFDDRNQRMPSIFSSLLHGTVVQPNGVLEGKINVYGGSAALVRISEATPGSNTGRRTFTLRLPQ